MITIKKKYIITITIIIIITIITIPLLYKLIYKQDKKETKIEAKILLIGSEYLLVNEKNKYDYLIYTKDLDYNIGDTIKIYIKEINKNKSPYEATATNISLIKKTDKLNETNNEKETDTQIEENNNNNINNNNKEINNNTIINNQNSDNNIIQYFENLNNDLENYNNENESISKKIKEKFVNCIDFIFYEKEINDITFNELSNKTKLKILEITLSIDNKINNKFPDYKENINNSYQNIKSKIIEKYLDITTNICNKDKELCTEAKESFKNIKNTFGITWSFIKELIGTGTSKLKDWYEIWRYN